MRRRVTQRPGKGRRPRVSAAVDRDIRRAIVSTSARFNVSYSYVIKVALADWFSIDLDKEDRFDGERV